MNQPSGGIRSGLWHFVADDATALVHFDRVTAVHSRLVVTLKVPPVGDTTVVDEPLRAGEVPSVAINADELHRGPV